MSKMQDVKGVYKEDNVNLEEEILAAVEEVLERYSG